MNISEQNSELSARLLLQVLEALSRFGLDATRLIFDIGIDGAKTLAELLKSLKNQPGAQYDAPTQKAISQLEEACKKENSSPAKITIAKSDLPDIEKWLKKQDLLYVACSSKGNKATEAAHDSQEASETATIFFMAKDTQKVENAVAIQAYQKQLINNLPPQAFFLLFDDKTDVSVVDGLDIYELNVFRELSKKVGLGYTEMANPAEAGAPATYKVVCEKGNADKLTAAMRLVSWNMTGEHAPKIKEKVLERESFVEELETLLTKGVKEGNRFFVDDAGNHIAVENAKYVVNALIPNQYVKVTAKSFSVYKGGSEVATVSKSEPDYFEKLEDALSEFSDFVVVDSLEWEKNGLNKSNLRKTCVAEKLSVFPPKYSLEKEEAEMRRARRRQMENQEHLDDAAWLFHKFDPNNDNPISEVVEEHDSASSKPLEATVSAHYNSAVKRAEKYKYYDVESDERSVDNIIAAAQKRVDGKEMPSKDKERAELS